ncbi:flavin reductase family protein [Xylanibacillus composti]|uniref:Flavin reductase n=1 Tax=Xylanibacillus composti TaxID=1572762 RepID=A0A8J4H4R4_9BACL|nr:flavin reductase family protein [Xylanibacillus composti]MDT9724088.1 flavin reductase family protein [Xylanibacillus composti]GIQ69481.1 flavin reductase [Xylanibacillus composti]
MLVIDPAALTARENYQLLTASVIPRPIALVTTLSQEGVLNAAPFSYFSIVASDPPLLSVSVQRKQGVRKDTARNAVERKAFVVHIVDETNVHAANEAAASLPPNESEMPRAGFTPVASAAIEVPGIQEAKIRMECVLEQAIGLGGAGEQEPACDLLIGRVVRFHFAEEVYLNGIVAADRLQPVSRLGGSDYAVLGKRFALERP